jgi:hypothetical protein
LELKTIRPGVSFRAKFPFSKRSRAFSGRILGNFFICPKFMQELLQNGAKDATSHAPKIPNRIS